MGSRSIMSIPRQDHKMIFFFGPEIKMRVVRVCERRIQIFQQCHGHNRLL